MTSVAEQRLERCKRRLLALPTDLPNDEAAQWAHELADKPWERDILRLAASEMEAEGISCSERAAWLMSRSRDEAARRPISDYVLMVSFVLVLPLLLVGLALAWLADCAHRAWLRYAKTQVAVTGA